MTKINPERLKVTYATQGRGVYSKERSQKDVDIWQIDETDAEENAVINDIAQEVYEQELSSARVLDFVEDFGLGYSAATAVTTIVKVCGTPKDDRHYVDKIEDLDRAIEHIERIQARIMRAAEAVR
mgnify:FL=1